MEIVLTGQEYECKVFGDRIIVNNVTRVGRGYQITYTRDFEKGGFITSRGDFLRSYKLVG